jgi:hypothetical protein
MESVWGSTQIEFNRPKWRTKMELGGAMADYIENSRQFRRADTVRSASTPRTISKVCTQRPARKPFCPKRWPTEWGLPQLVGRRHSYSNLPELQERIRSLFGD